MTDSVNSITFNVQTGANFQALYYSMVGKSFRPLVIFEFTSIEVLTVTCQLRHKRRPSVQLSDLRSPIELLESEQYAVLAFYTGAQYAYVGHA